MLKELPGLNVYHFQTRDMFILRFSFEGFRNLCASRLVGGLDLEEELARSAVTLKACYPGKRVKTVEIVAYERGSFDYFTWPEGLELLSKYYDGTVLTELPTEETAELAEAMAKEAVDEMVDETVETSLSEVGE